MISTLNFNHSIKKVTKQINYDLKNSNNCLNIALANLPAVAFHFVIVIYIYNLHYPTKNCKIYHFSDDINLEF